MQNERSLLRDKTNPKGTVMVALSSYLPPSILCRHCPVNLESPQILDYLSDT